MPELPEVETIRRGLEPLLSDQIIRQVTVRRPDLRWPIPAEVLRQSLPGQTILAVTRRGKYLLLPIADGTLIVHLGMSGVLRYLAADTPFVKHDHFDLALGNGAHLRLNDPRRFGAVLWTTQPAKSHPLIASLGPEPLTDDFSKKQLYEQSRGRKLAIKNFIMDAHHVVGVGNIYAAEALFLAGIHPEQAAGDLTKPAAERLVSAIKKVLTFAIEQGGTTLKDFRHSDGQPGYFQQSLNVYGRQGQGCPACSTPIEQIRLGGRSTAFCPQCQKC
ncbi:MAG: bifunctional DNA-formamidopyrimidine glycosylase/DNA-(apurinic or apyrimidinic site) lyase [Magnetococcales bacterium]|nr:bifunctional DNA-formamidopyrimidine glycosylase/DNA-(apurinic or apyrimidinic site) lyase [Magnetococcales bacterium]